ncbi:hypothetical protein ADIS_4668 [Lunatimonas lonarensis]|uniref:DUF4071 domain-containing protein n=1 Tax=Lunatimonas lonarensis TaxID=1232681 RepID=R7ZLA7_9BACT|nr:tetratricopeptide repeat-containing protein [Lunatimonas lonarensis]EON74873.1 hypothetical protein ADIS_4668 [Lunatimonas lonarensis]
MDVFIVRPFKEKTVSQKSENSDKAESKTINFDKVEELLIQPALRALNLRGGTTGEIFKPGEIRVDMFSLLLLADLVIADITIHNANVFYELGIRHALRKNKTILIWSRIDSIPFDIKGYRYVEYDADNPAASTEALVKTLKESMESNDVDSPVFNMLPKLNAQDPEDFLAIPIDFSEDVELAGTESQKGKLSLMAAELDGLNWRIPGFRKIGNQQFDLKAIHDAKYTFEKIRDKNPDDYEANDRLATIFQRLSEEENQSDRKIGLLKSSDHAIERVLRNQSTMTSKKLAETYSLRARNAKTRWMERWKNDPNPARTALISPELDTAFEDYERGFESDLNHFYSGINALSLLTIKIGLVEKLPEVWATLFEEDEDSERALIGLKKKLQKLCTMVEGSINAVIKTGTRDSWVKITAADFLFLTSKNPERVKIAYQGILGPTGGFNYDSAKRQLLVFRELGILTENVDAVLPLFRDTPPKEKLVIIFTGHMIDSPSREVPRFPAEKEPIAKEHIKKAIEGLIKDFRGEIIGIAGGACGGDILFHEVCQELSIQSELYLPMSREKFLETSVRFAGNDWVKRFDSLYAHLPKRFLSENGELPKWLKNKADYTIWERNNNWILRSGLADGGLNATLIALWDEKEGDGHGGTKHMVATAQKNGAKTEILSTKELFGLVN